MSTRLSDLLTQDAVHDLRHELEHGRFPGVTLEDAIRFWRSDGIVPVSGRPPQSFLDLEDWIRARER